MNLDILYNTYVASDYDEKVTILLTRDMWLLAIDKL